MAKPKFNTGLCLIPKLMFSPLSFAQELPHNSKGWNARGGGREPSDKTAVMVMVLVRDTKNLDQDHDSRNIEMDMDFIGSYEGILHSLRFS